MKRMNRVDLGEKNTSLKRDFYFPDYSPHEYACENCGFMLKLYQFRVLYCRHCHKGKLHPRYVWTKDALI